MRLVSRAIRTSMPVIAQLQHPAKLAVRPLPVGQKPGWVGAQGLDEFGDFSVVPANQNAFAVLERLNLVNQVPEFPVPDLAANL